MTMTDKTVNAKAQDKIEKVVFRIRTLEKAERTKAALKILGIFWGLALATLPLPPLHWVTVPVFFVTGPIMAFRKYQFQTAIQAKNINCPVCTKEIPVKEQAEKWPLQLTCPHCRNIIELVCNS